MHFNSDIKKNLNLLSASIFLSIAFIVYPSKAGLAQESIISDDTLSTSTSVTNSDNLNYVINAGQQVGNNLFHSFRRFSISNGGSAIFENNSSVENIISRVTGNDVSRIDGIIQTSGSANLFLVNPRGIAFGPNANLMIGGSFLATTANSIVFEDGSRFSSVDNETSSLLTMKTPVGLQFGLRPGSITTSQSNLSVLDSETIAFVGSSLVFRGGMFSAPSGRVELGSVAGNSQVNIESLVQGWELQYPNSLDYQDLQLLDGLSIFTFSDIGGGDVTLQGKNISLREGTQITTFSTGLEPGGGITVNASENLEIVNPAMNSMLGPPITTGLFSSTVSAADAGDINIGAKQLIIQGNNAVIASESTPGQLPNSRSGRGGDIFANVSDSVELIDGGAISASTRTESDAGDIAIRTKDVLLTNGSRVFSDTLDIGSAGSIEIIGTKSITLSGVAQPSQFPDGVFTGASSGFFTESLVGSGSGSGSGSGKIEVTTGSLKIIDGAVISAQTNSNFDGGDIVINADSFKVSGGGQVLTTTSSFGNAGSITLNIEKDLELSRSDPTYFDRLSQVSKIFGETEAQSLIDPISPNSGIFASTNPESNGNAGSISVGSPTVLIQDGAGVAVNSAGIGFGGEIDIEAENFTLDNQAFISAETVSSQGGNIQLSVDDLLLLNRNSQISATAGIEGGIGDGGNITIDTALLVALDSSAITAEASLDMGGNIGITTQGLFLSPDSEIDASSAEGVDGEVVFDTPETDPSDNTTEFSERIDIPPKLAQVCRAGQALGNGQFANVGTGGLPPTPTSLRSYPAVWHDIRPPENLQQTSKDLKLIPSEHTSENKPIIEANSWVKTSEGLMLVAPNQDSSKAGLNASGSC